MFYSDTDILLGIRDGAILIPNFDPDRLGPNSYDVLLGGYFYEVVWFNREPWYIGPQVYEPGEQVKVPNNGTLLAMTADIVGSRGKIGAMMKSRSTTRRKGQDVCMSAGLGDIGYFNHWTMELSAFAPGGVYVTVGQPIAQLLFFETKSEPTKPYDGQYRERDWPLCMVPKDSRHRIVAKLSDIPRGVETDYVSGGKIG